MIPDTYVQGKHAELELAQKCDSLGGRPNPETEQAFRCSIEQIAGLIYLNIAQNFRADRDACKRYFETIGIPLFQ